MERPSWRELLRQKRRHRTMAHTPAPPLPRARYGLAILSALIAFAAYGVGSSFQKYLHKSSTAPFDFGVLMTSAGVFVVFGSYATRRAATQVGRLISYQGGKAAGAAVRLIATLIGLIIVLIATLGMLGVPISRLLLGGAITGVVLGIAAQQSLGNLFAGLVLILARPFTVGSHIRLRSGALGGIIDGEVISIGLTYVVIDMEDGHLFVPNLAMLAAGVVRLGDPVTSRSSELYVNRALPKRPPRHPAAPQRRTSTSPHTTRLPREMVRRMRQRRALRSPAAESPPSSTAGGDAGSGPGSGGDGGDGGDAGSGPGSGGDGDGRTGGADGEGTSPGFSGPPEGTAEA
jgi:uncharacterized membrane protein YgcG